MKRKNGRIITMIASVAVLFATAAQAQHLVSIVKVTVPFEFVAGDKQFDAGEYSLVSDGPYMLQLRNAKAQTVAIFYTKPVESAKDSGSAKLDFVVADGNHLLSTVWLEGTRGQELYLPKAGELVAKRNGTTRTARAGGQ